MRSTPDIRAAVAAIALGAVILGIGGRVAMAAIVLSAGGSPRFTLEGTLRLAFIGAIGGVVGLLLALVSRGIASRIAPQSGAIRHAIFAVLLLLVTALGFWASELATEGNQPQATAWLYLSPVVALYGLALAFLLARLERTRMRV